jgi:hypothetical protein
MQPALLHSSKPNGEIEFRRSSRRSSIFVLFLIVIMYISSDEHISRRKHVHVWETLFTVVLSRVDRTVDKKRLAEVCSSVEATASVDL